MNPAFPEEVKQDDEKDSDYKKGIEEHGHLGFLFLSVQRLTMDLVGS